MHAEDSKPHKPGRCCSDIYSCSANPPRPRPARRTLTGPLAPSPIHLAFLDANLARQRLRLTKPPSCNTWTPPGHQHIVSAGAACLATSIPYCSSSPPVQTYLGLPFPLFAAPRCRPTCPASSLLHFLGTIKPLRLRLHRQPMPYCRFYFT